MKKKVIILPGVGFQSTLEVYNSFANEIKSGVDIETEIFLWQHSMPFPSFNLAYESARVFLTEVLLDFQYILLRTNEIVLPEADFYIGHSAGSIIMLFKTDKPSILMGSPALIIDKLSEARRISELLPSIVAKKDGSTGDTILNIYNRYDVLGYPLGWDNVRNFSFSENPLSVNTYNPLMAHTSYWKNKTVINTVRSQLKEWITK